MSTLQGMTEQDIAQYLSDNPAFFERHAELLAAVQLTHPLGRRAVSLQERQAEMLRDKIRAQERQLLELMRHGQENMQTSERLHRWMLLLMRSQDAAGLPDLLLLELQRQFQVPQAGLRLWGVAEAYAGLPCAERLDADLKSFAASLAQPYCGVNAGFEALSWLSDPGAVASVALIPLSLSTADKAFGLLVLGSPDPTRYTAEMGTDFLQQMGEFASAALGRLLPCHAVA